MLAEIQSRHDRDRGSMIRWLIQLAYNVGNVGNRASSVRQSCVNDASIVRQFTDMSAPLVSRAPVRSKKDLRSDQKDLRSDQKDLLKGDARGKLVPSQAKLIVARVIKRINELRPSGTGFTPDPYQRPVETILKAGSSEEDLIAVVEWKAAECQRQGDWAWFKPATLFRPTKFAEKLDEAKAGVSIDGKQSTIQRQATQQQGFHNGEW